MSNLIPAFSLHDEDSLTDWLMILMRHIESALVQCGAKSGEDYTYRDLMGWALQLHTAKQTADNIEKAAKSLDYIADALPSIGG